MTKLTITVCTTPSSKGVHVLEFEAEPTPRTLSWPPPDTDFAAVHAYVQEQAQREHMLLEALLYAVTDNASLRDPSSRSSHSSRSQPTPNPTPASSSSFTSTSATPSAPLSPRLAPSPDPAVHANLQASVQAYLVTATAALLNAAKPDPCARCQMEAVRGEILGQHHRLSDPDHVDLAPNVRDLEQRNDALLTENAGFKMQIGDLEARVRWLERVCSRCSPIEQWNDALVAENVGLKEQNKKLEARVCVFQGGCLICDEYLARKYAVGAESGLVERDVNMAERR